MECNSKSVRNWMFYDACLQGQVVTQNMSSGVIVSTRSLVLQGVTRHDGGSYACVAANSRGESTSAAVQLRVQCEWNSSFILLLYFFPVTEEQQYLKFFKVKIKRDKIITSTYSNYAPQRVTKCCIPSTPVELVRQVCSYAQNLIKFRFYCTITSSWQAKKDGYRLDKFIHRKSVDESKIQLIVY